METPSRENQEPQEAASGDELFFVEHLRFFFSNLMKMSSNAKVLNLRGCARHGDMWHVHFSPRDMQILRRKSAYKSSQIGSTSS